MVQIINLAVGTFTIFCVLVTFGISWTILNALRVPDVWAFIVSMMYSCIPIYLWIREEVREIRGESNDTVLSHLRIPPTLSAGDAPVRKVRRSKRSSNDQGIAVQSGSIPACSPNGGSGG